MDKFYKRMKTSYIFGSCFLFIMLILAIIENVKNKNYEIAFLVLFGVAFIFMIATMLLLYYKNIVISINFDDKDNAIIKTNCKTFILPNKYFIEVNNAISMGRILIKYFDGELKKTFIFQTRYSPFKIYSLNFDEMKKHMTLAVFKES